MEQQKETVRNENIYAYVLGIEWVNQMKRVMSSWGENASRTHYLLPKQTLEGVSAKENQQ